MSHHPQHLHNKSPSTTEGQQEWSYSYQEGDEHDRNHEESDSDSHSQSTAAGGGGCLPPSGVITTQSCSSVILPGRKSATDPLQFVKIQAADLSKKAKEQIRLAEEVKITKEKIKEVEEEWQSNLLNWKSKRKVNKSGDGGDDSKEGSSNGDADADDEGKRKIKTFSEILTEKAKSGHRIGYNLHRYGGYEEDLDEDDITTILRHSSHNNNGHENGSQSNDSSKLFPPFVSMLYCIFQ